MSVSGDKPIPLAYEQLRRPDALTIERGENGVTIIVPPPKGAARILKLVLPILVLIALAVAVALELLAVRRGNYWRLTFACVFGAFLAIRALLLPYSLAAARSWTHLAFQRKYLAITRYHHSVWLRADYDLEPINRIVISQGPIKASFQRDRALKIVFEADAREPLEVLQHVSLPDLMRIADALTEELHAADQ